MAIDQSVSTEERRRCARVLAGSCEEELAQIWENWPARPPMDYLRRPEAGLVMVQARIGGSGDRFNFGEATVTRATVVLRPEGEPETVGTSYVLGSHPGHAGLAAVFDALLFTNDRQRVLQTVIEPLEKAQAERDALKRAEARTTTVDFFTVAREHE